MTDLACVVHLHSTHSDGTGTVPEIADAARRADVDVVLLTDHDTLAARDRGEDGRYGGVLVIAGHEVSPRRGDHLLAFGLDEVIAHRGLDARQIAEAVRAKGGLAIAAHPWSSGNPTFGRIGKAMPFRDLEAVDGVELWSIVTDTSERVGSLADVARFVARPDRMLDHPPPGRLATYDAMTAQRRVVAIGGIDAHQAGIRIAGHVPLRLMAYHRSFRLLHTRVLLDAGEQMTEDAVLGALREGRCYLARDSIAPARGFSFEAPGVARMGEEATFAEGTLLRLRLPRRALVTLRCNGEPVATAYGDGLEHRATRAGAYRIEAVVGHAGRDRTWVISNPIYLRG